MSMYVCCMYVYLSVSAVVLWLCLMMCCVHAFSCKLHSIMMHKCISVCIQDLYSFIVLQGYRVNFLYLPCVVSKRMHIKTWYSIFALKYVFKPYRLEKKKSCRDW